MTCWYSKPPGLARPSTVTLASCPETLSVNRAAGSEFLLNLSVGPPGGAPEDFTYLEFPLSSQDARAVRDALA